MLATLEWWLAIQVTGLLALPLTMRLLRHLPDRGAGMARPVGLLLCGVCYWLLVTFGLLRNGVTGVVVVLLLLGLASARCCRGNFRGLVAELQHSRRQIIVGEVVFALGLAGFALFRAYNPDIAYTEKPMEFGFINAILRSPDFPPRDPWLSGYAISYYYLGYVLVAMGTFLTGLPSGVTYNLTNATLFALTLSGAYSLVANMCAAHQTGTRRDGGVAQAASWGPVGGGILGSVLVAVAGNLEGVLEVVRARGWGSERLFAWLDVKGLTASVPQATWYPNDGWWWWRASRVIHDKDLLGQSIEAIDEFPFFSFLLGDNHPHVLALPFILLALSLALNVLLSGADAALVPDDHEGGGWWRRLKRGLWSGGSLDIPLWGVLVGALGFLNTWDYPIYLALLVLAYMARRYREYSRRSWGWVSDGVTLGLLLGAIGLACYLPFYAGFRSQAGGLGLWWGTKTRPIQYLLMFGTQVALVSGYLVAQALSQRAGGHAMPRATWALWGVGAALALGCAAAGWWTAALSTVLGAFAGGLALWRVARPSGGCAPGDAAPGLAWEGADVLALFMILAGFALTSAVEVVYLQDSFGTRMNTVFKFYYQAWVLLSLAGAYGAYRLLSAWRGWRLPARVLGTTWAVVCGTLLCGALVYPVTATVSKANAFRGEPTLDGTRYVARQRPAEYAAITWLQEHAPRDAVLVEASGGSYTEYNWISAHTGIPTLLGWGGHELQWRGNYEEASRREEALNVIYRGNDPETIAAVLVAYDADYVVLGPREEAAYGAGQATRARLDRLLDRVYEADGLIVYGARRMR